MQPKSPWSTCSTVLKSRDLSPRKFVRRVKQLSGYIDYLPGVYYSSQATSQMTKTRRLTDPQVAQLALRLCPPAWKTAWKMLKKEGMPQDLEDIIQFMELQESAEKSSTEKAKAQNFCQNNNSSQNGGNQAGSNKRKGNSGQNGGSSKKA